MTVNIKEEELKLLAFLHENVRGFGKTFALHVRTVALGLNAEDKLVRRDSSYLSEHGLVGIITERYAHPDGVSDEIKEIYLTGLGEDYMRALEKAPGVARILTVGAVTELWGAGKGIIVSAAGHLLFEALKNFHR